VTEDLPANNASLVVLKDPKQTKEDIEQNGLNTVVLHDGFTLQFVGRFRMTPAEVLTFLRSSFWALTPGKLHIDHICVIHDDPDPSKWKLDYNPPYEKVNCLRITVI
jgi:hypothetical protein